VDTDKQRGYHSLELYHQGTKAQQADRRVRLEADPLSLLADITGKEIAISLTYLLPPEGGKK